MVSRGVGGQNRKRGCKRYSIADIDMRLEDWVWRRRGGDEGLQLANLFSGLFSWCIHR